VEAAEVPVKRLQVWWPEEESHQLDEELQSVMEVLA
jgi:hypothetical protein